MDRAPASRTHREIAHDLRSPLASILGFAELMGSEWDQIGDDQKREFVQIIERQARRLGELIEEVAEELGRLSEP